MIARALFFALFLGSTVTFASSTNEAALADDPVAEKRLQALSRELRCLVCQNETIADSNAELAVDLRREIRHMIREGQSDTQILDFLVARYGDFVLYRPPLKGTTALLWAGPVLFLVVALLILVTYLRRRTKAEVTTGKPLSADEARRVAALLEENRPK